MAVPIVAAEAVEGAASSSTASAAARSSAGRAASSGGTKTWRGGRSTGMATQFPGGPPTGRRRPAPAQQPAPPAAEPDTEPAGSDGEHEDQGDGQAGDRRRRDWRDQVLAAPRSVDASGFVLGALFYGWVLLPLLTGGPGAVQNVLRAKFFNQGPKGEWLP